MRNRLDRSQEPGSQLDLIRKSHSAASHSSNSAEVPLSLFGPERYEPRYEYPLIVWLHSCHSNERELEDVMPPLSLQNYVACAPRAPQASKDNGRQFIWPQTRAAATVAEEAVFASIAAAMNSFSIARNRVFLAGFGSGGTMAMRIALRYPRQFAGVVSICGQFPQNHQPLNNLVAARHLPMMWMYGQDSTHCSVEHICEVLPLLHAARMGATIRQYPAKDELLTNMLSDLNHWLMEQVTNQPTSPENSVEESFSRN
ncbi:MAG: alpha/beta hydrolase [Aureliella sp.]